ncbi:beta-ketoacyl-ACP synthase III [Myroides pelagicus]|uniref:Beta-ketoacyl-[acyl-carrier-protein] synthase III n=1 Tax=Myroides pelagicus TaxID=270914 RepID=A0A7K1GJI9_9FLAO|nr:beta-ketoacyl-ACP synthase III [Myroides pelagicus]MTH28593.1 beta-ketoacyl-ACP synthase III [Myroides pelagicus]
MTNKPQKKTTYPSITAIGGYVPENKRTNEDLEKISNTNDEWITKRTGIKERRILDKDLATSDMAIRAIENLLVNHNKELSSIDAIIVATSTPDMPMPSTANIICGKLNLKNVWAFDINAACSGFLYALDMGASLVETGRYSNILVIGADKISTFVDINDRSTNILFGDGAGVVWLEPTDEEGITDALLLSNGLGKEYLNIEGGGSLYPLNSSNEDKEKAYIKQDGKVVFKNAVIGMSEACKDLLNRNNFTINDIDWLVPHQANKRIIDAVGKEIGIESDKALNNITYYGNTIAATIPLCIWEHKEKFKKGDRLLLTAFGAGFSWGASILKWTI